MMEKKPKRRDRRRPMSEQIWDLLPAALYIKDEEGRYLAINRYCEALFKVGEEAVRGRTDYDLFSAGIAEAITRTDAAVRAGGRPLTIREVATAGGQALSLLATKFPIPGPDGRNTHICGISIDIGSVAESERLWLDARQEAERANQARSRFLSAINHDLRQPMQAATLFLNLLQTRVAGGGPSRDLGRLVELLSAAVESLRTMLDTLLEIARLDAGMVQPAIVEMPLGPVLARLSEEFGEPAARAGLDFRMIPSSATVASDPVLLERLLRPLLANAVAYTRHGRVLLGCRRRPDAVEIQVWDTGCGIPAERLGEIFEDFVQVDNPERNRTRGLGLGLSITARLAALLGCRVTARSQPGRGSMFGVTVPLAAPRQPARPDSGAAGENGPGRRFPGHLVMIIEDDSSVLDGLSMLLETWGLRTVGARSLDELSRQFPRIDDPPSLIIADYRLPAGSTGRDAINLVRRTCAAEVPAIIITGDTARERLQEAVATGARLLHKPVRVEELRDALMRLLPPERRA